MSLAVAEFSQSLRRNSENEICMRATESSSDRQPQSTQSKHSQHSSQPRNTTATSRASARIRTALAWLAERDGACLSHAASLPAGCHTRAALSATEQLDSYSTCAVSHRFTCAVQKTEKPTGVCCLEQCLSPTGVVRCHRPGGPRYLRKSRVFKGPKDSTP